MKFLRKANRRKSIFATILLSYIVILLFPVLIGTYLYNRVESIMVGNANRANMGLLEQIKLVAESRFNEVDGMTLQIALNPKLKWALSNIDDNYARRQFNLADIMKDLKNVKNASKFIGEFFVYFKNTDTILTTSGKSDARTFFRDILVYNGKSFDQVKSEMFTGSRFRMYLPVAPIKEGDRISNVITYVQSLPLGEDSAKGYLVVMINEQEFDRLIKQIEKVNSGSIFVIDDHNQVIMSTMKDGKPGADLFADLGNPGGYDNAFRYNGEEMMLSYTTGQNGWKYVSIVPKKIVLEQVIALKNRALALLLFIVAAGIAASYIMALRNYNPIRELMRTIMRENHEERGKNR